MPIASKNNSPTVSQCVRARESQSIEIISIDAQNVSNRALKINAKISSTR